MLDLRVELLTNKGKCNVFLSKLTLGKILTKIGTQEKSQKLLRRAFYVIFVVFQGNQFQPESFYLENLTAPGPLVIILVVPHQPEHGLF